MGGSRDEVLTLDPKVRNKVEGRTNQLWGRSPKASQT